MSVSGQRQEWVFRITSYGGIIQVQATHRVALLTLKTGYGSTAMPLPQFLATMVVNLSAFASRQMNAPSSPPPLPTTLRARVELHPARMSPGSSAKPPPTVAAREILASTRTEYHPTTRTVHAVPATPCRAILSSGDTATARPSGVRF